MECEVISESTCIVKTILVICDEFKKRRSDIEESFSVYGQIVSFQHELSDDLMFTYITYANPKDASQALADASHTVRPGHQMLQPDFICNYNGHYKGTVPPVVLPSDDRCHFSILNDDCLRRICSYLHNDDLMNLMKTNQQLAVISSHKVRLDTTRLPHKETKSILQAYGWNITDVELNISDMDIVDDIVENCSSDNLKKLTIASYQRRVIKDEQENFTKMFSVMKSLQSIKILRYDGSDQIFQLPSCPKLIEFKTDYLNCQSIGELSEKFSQLRHLKCYFNRAETFSSVAKHWPNLKTLDVSFDEYDVDSIELEKNIRTLGNMTHLTKLRLRCIDRNLNLSELLRGLAKNSSFCDLNLEGVIPWSQPLFDALFEMKQLKSLSLNFAERYDSCHTRYHVDWMHGEMPEDAEYFLWQENTKRIPMFLRQLEYLAIQLRAVRILEKRPLVKFIDEMKELRKLEIDLEADVEFDLDTYFEIVKICQSSNRRKLQIVIQNWRPDPDLLCFANIKNYWSQIVELRYCLYVD